MRKIDNLWLFLLILAFSSCSYNLSISKRRYRAGYHVQHVASAPKLAEKHATRSSIIPRQGKNVTESVVNAVSSPTTDDYSAEVAKEWPCVAAKSRRKYKPAFDVSVKPYTAPRIAIASEAVKQKERLDAIPIFIGPLWGTVIMAFGSILATLLVAFLFMLFMEALVAGIFLTFLFGFFRILLVLGVAALIIFGIVVLSNSD